MKNELKNFVRSRNGLIENLTGKREPDILPLNINSNFTVTKKRQAKPFTELVNFCLFYINIIKIYKTVLSIPLYSNHHFNLEEKTFLLLSKKFIFRNKNNFHNQKIIPKSKKKIEIKNHFLTQKPIFETKILFLIQDYFLNRKFILRIKIFFESKILFSNQNLFFQSKFIFPIKNSFFQSKNHFFSMKIILKSKIHFPKQKSFL